MKNTSIKCLGVLTKNTTDTLDVEDDMWNKEEYQMLEMTCEIRC